MRAASLLALLVAFLGADASPPRAPKPPQKPTPQVIDYCDCARRGWCDCPPEVCTCQGCKWPNNPYRYDPQTKKWWRWGHGTVGSDGWLAAPAAPAYSPPPFRSPAFYAPIQMRGGRGGGC